MSKEILMFGHIEIKKNTAIKVLFLKDVDIEKVLASIKISSGGGLCKKLQRKNFYWR